MNSDSPGALIKKGESEVREFKEGFDKEAVETAVAFANRWQKSVRSTLLTVFH